MAIIVRRADIKDVTVIGHIHVDTWRTTYKGIMTDEFLSNLSYEGRQRLWEDVLRDPGKRTTVFVAENDGQPVGFASCGAARDEKEFEGELYAIYVLRSSQGRGIGRRLVRSVVQDLRTRGFNSMLIWVLDENPFKRFYESLGGRHVRTRRIEIGGRTLTELGYGWKTLDSPTS